MEVTNKRCSEIISNFGLCGEVVSCKKFGSGHINFTFLVDYCGEEGEKTYVLQAINTNVFKNIRNVMDNISRVTEHLKAKSDADSKVMNFLKTEEGVTYFAESESVVWRIYEFIDNSICIDFPDSLDDFYQCALAFGKFQHDLADFPAETLFDTIPDFHNTPKRYQTFLNAVENDVMGRAASVQPEIDFIKQRKDFYSILFDNNKLGKLPIRVSHNDTKSNNVLLDSETHKAICVIDLDTIMPGFSVNDFGDSIRFGASTAAEDEKDLSKVNFDFEKFKVYAKGFLDGCDGLLTDDEIMLLPEGAKMMTIECGIRFLTDYLEGDTYFRTAYEGHNLDRCRTQLKLVADMEKYWDEMKAFLTDLKNN